MHAGNVYSSLAAWLIAKSQGGRIVLRVEDLDVDRSRQEYIDQLQRDYEALGLFWDEGPYYQATRSDVYEEALQRLHDACGTYPCFCSRADLKAASAPHFGEKAVYAGTCRGLSAEQQAEKRLIKSPSTRVVVPDQPFEFQDLIQGSFGQNLAHECGDFLVRRADGLFAYQLAVVVDDAAQGVNSIVRGYDLITSTPQQLFLQQVLGFEHPTYAHVPLIVNGVGKRLSKRDKDAALDELLSAYGTPEGVIGHIAYVGKLVDRDEALSPQDLLSVFDLEKYIARVRDEVGLLQPITWF